MIWCDLPPFRSAMKPTPQASYSRRGIEQAARLRERGRLARLPVAAHRWSDSLRSRHGLDAFRADTRCLAIGGHPCARAPRAPLYPRRSGGGNSPVSRGAERRRSMAASGLPSIPLISRIGQGLQRSIRRGRTLRQITPVLRGAVATAPATGRYPGAGLSRAACPQLKDSIADLFACKGKLWQSEGPAQIFGCP